MYLYYIYIWIESKHYSFIQLHNNQLHYYYELTI